jgi:hypothetical protein
VSSAPWPGWNTRPERVSNDFDLPFAQLLLQ